MEQHAPFPKFGFPSFVYYNKDLFPYLPPISEELLRGLWRTYRLYQKNEEESLFCSMFDELCSYNQWISLGLNKDNMMARFWRKQIQIMAENIENKLTMEALLQENPIDFRISATMPKDAQGILRGITLSALIDSISYQLFCDIYQWTNLVHRFSNPEDIAFNLDEITNIYIPDMRQLFQFHFEFSREELTEFSIDDDDLPEVTLSENEWKSRIAYTLYCRERRELKEIQERLFPYMHPAVVEPLTTIANQYLEYLRNSIKPQERPIIPTKTAKTLSVEVPSPGEVVAEGYQTSVKRIFTACKTDFEIGKTLRELQRKGWITNDKPRKAYYRFIRKTYYKRFDDSNADKGYRSV